MVGESVEHFEKNDIGKGTREREREKGQDRKRFCVLVYAYL